MENSGVVHIVCTQCCVIKFKKMRCHSLTFLSRRFTTDAHHSPTLVEGNCSLSLLARALGDNEVVQESQLIYEDYTEHLNVNIRIITNNIGSIARMVAKNQNIGNVSILLGKLLILLVLLMC